MNTTTFRSFKITPQYAKSITDKLAEVIITKVNQSTKTDNVLHLNEFGEADLFLVRAGKHYNALVKEEEQGIVSHTNFIELTSDDSDGKKIRFAIWRRIRSSEILR